MYERRKHDDGGGNPVADGRFKRNVYELRGFERIVTDNGDGFWSVDGFVDGADGYEYANYWYDEQSISFYVYVVGESDVKCDLYVNEYCRRKRLYGGCERHGDGYGGSGTDGFYYRRSERQRVRGGYGERTGSVHGNGAVDAQLYVKRGTSGVADAGEFWQSVSVCI